METNNKFKYFLNFVYFLILIAILLFIFRDEFTHIYKKSPIIDSVSLNLSKENIKLKDSIDQLRTKVILEKGSIVNRNKKTEYENYIIASLSLTSTDSLFTANLEEDNKKYGFYTDSFK